MLHSAGGYAFRLRRSQRQPSELIRAGFGEPENMTQART